jgi:hypothetical protein
MTNARDKANIPVLNFQSKGIDDNATSTAITVDSSGNIGIANTNPADFSGAGGQNLVVGSGSGAEGMTIYSGTASDGVIGFADGSSGTADYRGFLIYKHNGDAFQFGTSSSERMRLNSTGLGIGTSAPSEELEVSGGQNTIIKSKTTTSTALGGFEAWNNAIGYMKIYSYGSSASGSSFGGVANANLALFEGQAVSNVVFSTWGNAGGSNPDFIFAPQRSQKLIIKSDGKVGINQANPTEKLEVNGTVKATQFVGGGLNAFRNIIINGDMSLAQRGTSFSSQTAEHFVVDRFKMFVNGAMGTWTTSQSTTVPTGQGFGNSLKMDCTTADASPASTDILSVQQRFEGQNLTYLNKGRSTAESLTVSFWVRSNKTGTYIAELEDRDNTRYVSQSYTISSADTWEKKTVTFPGDTSGGLSQDNGESLRLNFWLGGGATWTSGTLGTTWHTTSANRAVGQVNLADSTSNEWYITGVQLEAGTSASDFEFLPHDVNLKRCQRYYHVVSSGNGNPLCIGSMYSSSALHGVVDLPTSMRARPTIVQTTGTNYYTVYRNNGSDAFSSLTLNFSGTDVKNIINFVNETEISGTAGHAGLIVLSNSASYFAVDAEL